MRARYVNISIHEDLAKKIDDYIKKSKLGFRSCAKFHHTKTYKVLVFFRKHEKNIHWFICYNSLS